MDYLVASVQVCVWVEKTLNKEVIIGVSYVLTGKLRLPGMALNVSLWTWHIHDWRSCSMVYICWCDKNCRILKKILSVEHTRNVSLSKLSLKGRNWVVEIKSVPTSVAEVYINTNIWLAQNIFVYFKDRLPKALYFFVFSPTHQMYNVDLHYPNCQFFSPFSCVNLQSHGDDKTCSNLPELIYILHQQKVEKTPLWALVWD